MAADPLLAPPSPSEGGGDAPIPSPPPGRPATPRPPTPDGFDASRAAQRAADPRGWRMADEVVDGLHDVIAGRRDIRKFRPDAVGDDVLGRVFAAAHRAPSVGLMQPWRFIVVRSPVVRGEVRRLAQRERLRQAGRFDERARAFLDQKIEGIVEAPLGIVVCCDHGDDAVEVLGRGTIPETDVYSTACAIQNLWLAARAEGLGIGWVSFYRPPDLRALLGMPQRVTPMAYLCVGWPDERPVRPGLEASGWSARTPLEAVVMQERWVERAEATPIALRPQPPHDVPPPHDAQPPHRDQPPHGVLACESHRDGLIPMPERPGDGVIPMPERPGDGGGIEPDRAAAIAVRDRADQLVRPAGSLGALDAALERWASITGSAPRPTLRAGVLVAAADHGHTERGTSLFPSEVSGQLAAAAARGETAVAVLARAGGHALRVVDAGLDGPTPPGVVNRKVRGGSRDVLTGPALTPAEHARAMAAGAAEVDALTSDAASPAVDLLIPGESGRGNTTTAALLAAALLGVPEDAVVGRGAGADAAALDRKRRLVDDALARHAGAAAGADPDAVLTAFGGLEFSFLTGAIERAAERRLPVLLDGFATGVAALAAVRRAPWVAEFLLAGHRSAEPGHGAILTELGLEPLLDLRLRLGEASGALLAVPLLAQVGALHHGMATFAAAGVDGPRPAAAADSSAAAPLSTG